MRKVCAAEHDNLKSPECTSWEIVTSVTVVTKAVFFPFFAIIRREKIEKRAVFLSFFRGRSARSVKDSKSALKTINCGKVCVK